MPVERRAMVYDTKLPLTWILSSAGSVFVLLVSVLWNVASQSNKLDQLVVQAEKTERRNIERDVKLEEIIRNGYEAKRNADIMNIRLETLEKVKAK